MLEVADLSVAIGGVPVLKNLSFTVERGSSVAVIGPNGSGKTMLFRALIGAVPHSGVVRWAADTRIGYVPQKLDLARDAPISAGDLLAARARLAGVSPAMRSGVLEQVALSSEILPRLIGTLSAGQFQRVLMASALIGAPDVLLLDELTAGVDEPGQERLNATMKRLQSEHGVTVLLISHDLSVVFEFVTHVLCLTREHTCFGIPRRLLTADLIAQAYGEPIALFRHDKPAH